jgi:myo-inositol-1-phosphate synthase
MTSARLDHRPLALMIAGMRGNTASTLIGALALLEAGVLSWQDVPSSVTGYVDAPVPSDIRYGGWDPRVGDLESVIARNALVPTRLVDLMPRLRITDFPALGTALDYVPTRFSPSATVAEVAEKVAENVRTFGESSAATRPIVLYLGAPSRKATPNLAEVETWNELRVRKPDAVPGALLYAAGAILGGADFVDFTPGEALTCPALWGMAVDRCVQLAGRDGSTGQTMLKAAVGEMLQLRGIPPESWYSSNHLGNNDGFVLAQPEYNWLKLADKTRGLAEIVGDPIDHVVSIDYMKAKGDRKESFDSVVARDVFGGEIRLRLNWEAWDSALATPMLVDLIRLIMLGQDSGLRGVQAHLGFFFKAPIGGRCESPALGHKAMVAFYRKNASSPGVQRESQSEAEPF